MNGSREGVLDRHGAPPGATRRDGVEEILEAGTGERLGVLDEVPGGLFAEGSGNPLVGDRVRAHSESLRLAESPRSPRGRPSRFLEVHGSDAARVVSSRPLRATRGYGAAADRSAAGILVLPTRLPPSWRPGEKEKARSLGLKKAGLRVFLFKTALVRSLAVKKVGAKARLRGHSSADFTVCSSLFQGPAASTIRDVSRSSAAVKKRSGSARTREKKMRRSRADVPAAWVNDENVALLTDLYELTMAQAYWKEGLAGEAVFSLFVRKLPARRNYLSPADSKTCSPTSRDSVSGREALKYLNTLSRVLEGIPPVACAAPVSRRRVRSTGGHAGLRQRADPRGRRPDH